MRMGAQLSGEDKVFWSDRLRGSVWWAYQRVVLGLSGTASGTGRGLPLSSLSSTNSNNFSKKERNLDCKGEGGKRAQGREGELLSREP